MNVTSILDREWIISCPRCGRSYYSSVVRCEVCDCLLQTPVIEKRVAVPIQTQEREFTIGQEVEYAGFLIRALSYTMDQIMVCLTSVVLVLSGYIGIHTSPYLAQTISEELLFKLIIIIFIIIHGVYYTFYHGYYGQTMGKMLMGLKVVRTSGEELSFPISFKRWLGYFVSEIFFGIGYLMPIFTQYRQALHDKIADTIVIRL